MTVRSQPYRLDLGPTQDLEDLRAVLPTVMSDADTMFQILFEDLRALSDALDGVESASDATSSLSDIGALGGHNDGDGDDEDDGWVGPTNVGESMLVLVDSTVADVTTGRHGLTPKLPNDATKYLDGSGAYSVPAGSSSEWTSSVQTTGDQTVTNSSTLVDSAELVIALSTTSAYLVEFLIIYSGTNAATDFKWQFVVPVGDNAQTVGLFTHTNTADSAASSSFNGGTNVWPSSAQGSGTDASSTKRVLYGRFMVFTNAASDLKFQFAQNSASPATSATLRTGSMLRVKKLV